MQHDNKTYHRISFVTLIYVLPDEPTSGLDAASASEIMALLRRLASETGVIIITSVHQPSSRVFNSFDQVRRAVGRLGGWVHHGRKNKTNSTRH